MPGENEFKVSFDSLKTNALPSQFQAYGVAVHIIDKCIER